MKRAFLAFLTALSLIALTSPAGATVKKHRVDVNWTQAQVTVPGGLADSSAMRAIGSASPTAHDTSSVIDLSPFVMPEKGAGQLPTAADSISWLRVDFYPVAASPTVAADSLMVTFQVSNDGVFSWVDVTPTSVFLTTSDTGEGIVILEQATTNTFYYVLRQRVGAVASGDLFFPLRSSSTAPTTQELFGWPYMRMIVQSDKTGKYDAKITGFVPACE